VNKRQQLVEKTQFGATISKRVLEKLKAYSDYVQQPINYCADRLLDYALENDLEFQAYLQSKEGRANSVTDVFTFDDHFDQMGVMRLPRK
jgi:predicted nucleic-acid-binding protein